MEERESERERERGREKERKRGRVSRGGRKKAALHVRYLVDVFVDDFDAFVLEQQLLCREGDAARVLLHLTSSEQYNK